MFGLAARGIAQDAGNAPTPKIGSIDIRFVGTANVSEQLVRANMQLRVGMDVDETLIDRDIRTLYKTGLFQFIEVKRDNRPDGTVGLVFELTPRYRVLAIRFEGAKQIKPSKLEKEVKEESYHRMERSYGSFHRSFTLPGSVDVDRIGAKMKNGVLEIHLPKKEAAKPRLIKVAA